MVKISLKMKKNNKSRSNLHISRYNNKMLLHFNSSLCLITNCVYGICGKFKFSTENFRKMFETRVDFNPREQFARSN